MPVVHATISFTELGQLVTFTRELGTTPEAFVTKVVKQAIAEQRHPSKTRRVMPAPVRAPRDGADGV
jgi:hypothetical protein